MAEPSHDPLSFFTHPGFVTHPGSLIGPLQGLPADLPALCKVVQGLTLHVFWAERYGMTLSAERREEV